MQFIFILQILTGNNDSTAIVYHALNSTDRTRFVRFYPVRYKMNACIRVELYGDEVKKGKPVIVFAY